jgi:hypothetical protein
MIADKYQLASDKGKLDSCTDVAKQATKTYVIGLLLTTFKNPPEQCELRNQVMAHLSHLKQYKMNKSSLPMPLKGAVDSAQRYAYEP